MTAPLRSTEALWRSIARFAVQCAFGLAVVSLLVGGGVILLLAASAI